MTDALKRHWPEYLMEAAGLMFFMVNAAWLTTVLEYPRSPVHLAMPSEFARRIVLGIVMGLVIVVIVYNPWGKRSGAHINPSVTWAFWRLGKIGGPDAVFYTLFQFLGGVIAAFTMKALLGAPFRDPKVQYATTRPGPPGAWAAFAAEFAITFVLVLVMLVAMNHKKAQKLTGWIVGLLIMLYLWFETPLSGMSLNAARTFGSALAGNTWAGLWVYFAAPVLAALLAAEVFVRMKKGAALACAKLHPCDGARCIWCGGRPLPEFPVQKEGAAPLLEKPTPVAGDANAKAII